jgi:PLP dependent protein
MQNRAGFISENIARIRSRIAAAAQEAGRSASEITLLAVTKKIPVSDIRTAMDAGLTVFGENKVQEAKEKFAQIGPAAHWHMLGHLQTNKARHAAAIFDMVQSIDSVRAAEALNRAAGSFDRQVQVLLEINIGEEEQKTGIAPEQAVPLAEAVSVFEHLRLRGLMSMAPVVINPEHVRPLFKHMRQLFDTIGSCRPNPETWTTLSMGMTNDFEVAIAEGSTMVRIGTGIFMPAQTGGRT